MPIGCADFGKSPLSQLYAPPREDLRLACNISIDGKNEGEICSTRKISNEINEIWRRRCHPTLISVASQQQKRKKCTGRSIKRMAG